MASSIAIGKLPDDENLAAQRLLRIHEECPPTKRLKFSEMKEWTLINSCSSLKIIEIFGYSQTTVWYANSNSVAANGTNGIFRSLHRTLRAVWAHDIVSPRTHTSDYFRWVKRCHNKDADALANQAMDERRTTVRRFPRPPGHHYRYFMVHFDGGHRCYDEAAGLCHGAAGFVVRGALQLCADNVPDFHDIAKAAVYLGPTTDSLETEVAASVFCTTAVLSYAIFDKWEVDFKLADVIHDKAPKDNVEIAKNITKMNDELQRFRQS